MAHPYARVHGIGYDYGPPVTVGIGGMGRDDMGTPQDNSDAEEVDANGGESPAVPPGDADTIVEPGGSPTDESAVIPQDGVKITATVKDLTVTLNYTGPGIEMGCQIFWGDELEATDELATYVGPGTTPSKPPVTHTYAKAGTYPISVDPYGEMYPAVNKDVTVTAPAVAQTTTHSPPAKTETT